MYCPEHREKPPNLATLPERPQEVAQSAGRNCPICREKLPNLATLLNVITLQRQRKSMRPTENEAGMKLKL